MRLSIIALLFHFVIRCWPKTNITSIIEVLHRCQQHIRNRWKKKALKAKKDTDSYPTFKDFVEFVNLIASEACDPVYGTEAAKTRTNTMKTTSCNTVTNRTPVASKNSEPSQFPVSHGLGPSVRPCVVCGQSHRLFYCDTFKGMSPKSRLDIAKRYRLCYNCLIGGHSYMQCRKNSVCSVPGCGRKHTKFIHVDDVVSDVTQARSNSHDSSNGTSDNHVNVGSVHVHENCSNVYLPIVPVVLNGHREVYALLDTGSTNTFVTQRIAAEMNLDGSEVSYRMNTLEQSSNVMSKVVSFSLMSVDKHHKIQMNNVLVVSTIPARYCHKRVDVKVYPYLADLPIHHVGDDVYADVLIGMDHAQALMPLDIRCNHNEKNQPYAVKTLFGWCLNGPVGCQSVMEVSSHFVNIEQHVEKLWDMESVDEEMPSFSYEDRRVIDLWNQDTRHEDGHYTIPIPWKEGRPNMPNNRYSAVKRLTNLINRLQKTEMLETYKEKLEKLCTDGYAEPVPESELYVNDGSVWYLPHHAVVSESKPGKVRIAFDCAAKLDGVSLNNQCLQGPDLNNKLLHVLLRFRQYQYAIMADIEAMYLQVKIPLKDRNSLRFLWSEDGSIIEYRMTSHLFGGVWCASSSTFALRKTVEDSVTASDLVRDTVHKAFYVDDMLKSVKSKEEAKGVIGETKQALKHGGFNLTKFVVNNQQLLENIDAVDRAKEVKEITSEMYTKALGSKWDIIDDTFYYTHKHSDKHPDITKRTMLSQLSAIYDPLGLVSQAVLPGKILFQNATRLKLSWDECVPPNLAQKWTIWLDSLRNISQIKFPRCVIPDEFPDGVAEIHTFCDASEVGYGVCSYIRIINKQGKIHVALLAGKTRLAPLKSVTIPRLELSAAVEAVKLDCVIRRELDEPVMESTFWTDSQITLAYIRNDSKRFKVFVANRVATIRRHSVPDQWHHIGGKQNPADVCSRGCDVSRFDPVWLTGPQFLSEYKNIWPVSQTVSSLQLDDQDPEIKQEKSNAGQVSVNFVDVPDKEDRPHPFEELIKYYSSYYRLKKAICWITRVIQCIKGDKKEQGPISVAEMNQAEVKVIKYVQSHIYQEELELLRQGKNVSSSSPLYQLEPTLTEGLLVVGGRLKHAAIINEMKHPMILPHNHKLSQMIIQEYHNTAHLGTEWTLSHIRNKYWITKARNLAKQIKRDCVVCKRLYGKTLTQKMADLPTERCEPGKPAFSYVGVDLFGPFYIKQGRSEVKRYGCLYTCFTSRAIHIEVLNSLETDTFINGFIRFISRRGYPIRIWSDNGTNFVGARTELSKSLRDLNRSRVIQAARRKNVDWIFNPPLASHHGGAWERMIRTVRRVLLSLLSSSPRMTDEILQTVMCEAESIVNSRPITKSSEDINDDTPLSPNHLLLLRENCSIPWGIFHNSDTYRKHWRHVQHLSTQFWKRWIHEYLPELQRRQKWNNPVNNLKVGDLVLMLNESSPRGSWPLGLVIETSIGRDGLVRSARIRSKGSEFVRPVTKLVLLEGSS